jgi:hypothetical protein
VSYNEIDLAPNKFSHQFVEASVVPIGPTEFDSNGSVLDVAVVTQALSKSIHKRGISGSRRLSEEADPWKSSPWLRTGNQWPRHYAAQQSEELAPIHPLAHLARLIQDSGRSK